MIFSSKKNLGNWLSSWNLISVPLYHFWNSYLPTLIFLFFLISFLIFCLFVSSVFVIKRKTKEAEGNQFDLVKVKIAYDMSLLAWKNNMLSSKKSSARFFIISNSIAAYYHAFTKMTLHNKPKTQQGRKLKLTAHHKICLWKISPIIYIVLIRPSWRSQLKLSWYLTLWKWFKNSYFFAILVDFTFGRSSISFNN